MSLSTDTFVPMFRAWSLLLVGAVSLAACSGGGHETSPVPEASAPSTVAAAEAPADRAAAASKELAEDSTMLAEVVPQWSVTIDVVAEGVEGLGDVEASIGWTGDPDDVVDGGPFGSFGACSGLRQHVGAYTVFVSGGEGEVDTVAIWTSDRVNGPGVYEAEVRVEVRGDAAAALGTLTVLDGLQQGEFVAFGPDGGRIEGSFSCSGADAPTPLRVDTPGSIEVFAVLSDGGAERLVALATESNDAAVCSPEGPSAIRVEGDATSGSITALEIGTGTTPTVRMRVAGTDYELDDPDVTVGEAGAGMSGVFSGSVDGVSVDGAFTCT